VPACSSCGADVGPGARFCAQCGAVQGLTCPGCGAESSAKNRFCPSCGTTLTGPSPGAVAAAGTPPAGSPPAPVSERRLVSVLFADLVGFTTLSEHRDPEEVRELLSRYFERCRTVIERYGGTVEKFIGDAVMAVWGSPVAREDDAERAVRAGLDLVDAVLAVGEEIAMPQLRVRAGVLTGTAAVEIGAEGEGMVLGDTVNTASRLQSIAAPGTVLVDTVTRRAAEAAIAFQDAGVHPVNGREQPVHAWTALRVVARVGGSRRAGLEAPLVGRDHIRQALIGEFDATLTGAGARLVTLIGEAGVGKSRMAWELEKHADGVSDQVLWHRGRSLSYGDGVAFWALAEMVRMRAGISEEEVPESAAAKLRETVERYVADPGERNLVEPRLRALLGLQRRATADQADLFSGWRLFFERLSDHAPVAMVFEDMQWADASLLDFVAYLYEWSAGRPIFMLVLTRPEMRERRQTPAEDGPSKTTISLGSLDDGEMETLLAAMIPGAPAELRATIRARAEGIPLYATEIVRMLVDRGELRPDGDRYVLSAPMSELEVPETLQALIAARIDGLPARERRLLRDAAVLGLRFTEAGVVSVSDLPVSEVRAGLAGLAERQLIALDNDPRSPERGQYGFAQGLVRRVAYGTLARRERKLRHLRAAEHLRLSWGAEAAEVADVRAAHLLDAVRADPDAADAGTVAGQARETLITAGERAAGLAAAGRAGELFAQAADLAVNDRERGQLLDRAMQAAIRDGDIAHAGDYGERAIALWEQIGEPRRAAVGSARLGRFLTSASGRYSEGLPRMQRSLEVVLASGVRDADLAEITLMLASHMCEAGDQTAAWPYVDQSLALAEELRLPDMISMGLNLKYLIRYTQGRVEEARALLLHSLLLAQEQDLPGRAIRAHNNLAAMLINRFHNREALTHLDEAGAIARRLGSRADAWLVEGIKPLVLFGLGRWDEAVTVAEAMTDDAVGDRYSAVESAAGRCLVLMARGELDQAAADIDRVDSEPIEHTEYAAMKTALRAALLRQTGDCARALELARASMISETRTDLDRWVQEVRVQALEAMLELGDLAAAEVLVGDLRTIASRADVPYLDVQADRFAARIAAGRAGPEAAGAMFRRAAAAFREHEDPFNMAVVMLEHAEVTADRPESAGLAEQARDTFERLGAMPWLRRARALQRTGAAA
jgi:class 3 adenylate cyclase/tetratricopeptide (TPR) repeat protein